MQTRLLTKPVPYTFVRGGYYYFTRRVPADLRQHYKYPRIVQGLRTSSPQEAKLQAKIEAAKLDAYWMQMRLAKSEVLGLSLIEDGVGGKEFKSSVVKSEGTFEGPTLLDALKVYLEQKGNGKAKSFRQSAERACGYVIENCGNKPLAAYTRQDALVFRNWLVARGLTGSSVTRNFSYVKAVINFALSEFALDIRNPFVGVYHDRSKGVVTPLVASGAEHLRDLPPEHIADAMKYLQSLQSRFENLFESIDILLTPISPIVCPMRNQGSWDQTWTDELAHDMVRHLQFTAPVNFAGCPAMAVPCEIGTATGMPVGSHFVGPIGGEKRLFELAYELEAAVKR